MESVKIFLIKAVAYIYTAIIAVVLAIIPFTVIAACIKIIQMSVGG